MNFKFVHRDKTICVLLGLAFFALESSFALAQQPRLSRVIFRSNPVTPEIFSRDLRTMPDATGQIRLAPLRDVEQNSLMTLVPWSFSFGDFVSQTLTIDGQRIAPDAFSTPLINVSGQNFSNSFPADPTGDVSELHYVQAINSAAGSVFRVYNKVDGSPLTGAILMETLGPATGACQFGSSDPQVVYDGLAQRWVLLELVSNGSACVYVSASSNILSTTWFRYEFGFSPFADYPKLAAWDNVYAVGANAATVVDPTNFIEKRSFFVLDKNQMLQGLPATFQTFDTGALARVFFDFGLALPIGIKGNNPPQPGALMTFVVPVDDELQIGGGILGEDQLLLYTVQVDFSNPANSVVTGPISLAIGEWSRSGGQAFQSNTKPLPMFTGTPMHRATYRNFGDREVITLGFTHTFNQDVNFGSLSAVRWIELLRVNGSSSVWNVAQDGEFVQNFGASPVNRFIPALQMDNSGNMALAYGLMSKGNAAQSIAPIEPSLGYTGRLRGDVANSMPIAETLIGVGSSPQLDNFFRWGDYFDMSLDPDGCRFWFTGQYMDDTNWGTRIASWKHDSCGSPDFLINTPSAVVSEVCLASGTQSIGPLAVNVDTLNSFWSDVSLAFQSLPTGVTANVVDGIRRPPSSTTATLQISNAAADGLGSATLRGTHQALVHDLNFPFDIAHTVSASPFQQTPLNNATNVALLPAFSWDAAPTADRYVLEVSTSNTFSNLVVNQTLNVTSFVPTNLLLPNTTYFWRIKSQNQCGDSAASPVRSFSTVKTYCSPITPTLVPDGGSLVRSVNIGDLPGDIAEMTMRVALNNGRGGDYRITLNNGSRSAVLLSPIGATCGTGSFKFIFDDADAATVTCSDFGTSNDNVVKPNNPLSVFNGQAANNTWSINIEDTISNGTAGTFLFFCINPIRTQTDSMFSNGFE